MIVGTGIDIVDMQVFRKRLNKDLISDLFLPGEIEYCSTLSNYYESYAGRFAAKEAAFKALGAGLSQGLRFKQVEVLREPTGSVKLKFTGTALEIAQKRGVSKAFLSLSHTTTNAVAFVLLEGEGSGSPEN
ncbi:MAG: holo-ACP synthase [FCB group bacterium]|nr:holo-ACP synthase [FCB group bacterium]